MTFSKAKRRLEKPVDALLGHIFIWTYVIKIQNEQGTETTYERMGQNVPC
jgi:hypothetical protein